MKLINCVFGNCKLNFKLFIANKIQYLNTNFSNNKSHRIILGSHKKITEKEKKRGYKKVKGDLKCLIINEMEITGWEVKSIETLKLSPLNPKNIL